MTLRALARPIAYRSGALGAYYTRRNAATLTVLMFHRVLPEREMRQLGADPLYTVTPQFLADCVAFLREHFAIVSLDDVLLSRERKKPLPRNSVLITFDDGWFDNVLYAAPALKGVPWLMFASTDAISQPDCWWQEALLWAVRSKLVTVEQLWQQATKNPSFHHCLDDASDPHAILMLYASLEANVRKSLLEPLETKLRRLSARPMMAAPGDLRVLKEAGVGIGAHGASHLPLSKMQDAEGDLRKARDLIMQWTNVAKPPVMSFPHGRYNNRTVRAARDLGYDMMFSSDPILNRCEGGWLDSDLIGRIAVDQHDVGNRAGKLVEDRLAGWLFRRDIRQLGER